MSKPANRLRDWRLELAYAGEQARLEAGLEVLNCALVLGVLFVMPRPIGHVTKGTRELCRDEQRLTSAAPPLPAVKPDLSKIVRALEDGLEGAVYSNDSRIVGYKEPLMIYDDERPPGADVEIWRVCG